MIEDLMKLKKQIDTMIETYKDLHPDDYELMDNGEYVTELEAREEYEKQTALKRIREGYYESTFRKKQGKKASKPSEGSPSLCVYGDS
tara:strand:- start:15620 stop:15883 length:264 start_codon:yes stop_codon:yes gene_type:complete